MKPKAGIDLDNVVFDLRTTFAQIYKEVTGRDISEQEHNYHIQPRELEIEVVNILLSRRCYREQQLIPYARESIIQLSERFKIYLVTRRHPSGETTEDTRYSLKTNNIPYNMLIFSPDKARTARRHNLAVFIEDHLKYANSIAKLTKCKSYLFDYPYNREGRDGVIEVKGFEDKSWWINFMKLISCKSLLR